MGAYLDRWREAHPETYQNFLVSLALSKTRAEKMFLLEAVGCPKDEAEKMMNVGKEMLEGPDGNLSLSKFLDNAEGGSIEGDENVFCPMCKDVNVHLGHVEIDQGTAVYVISKEGIIEAKEKKPSARGSLITLNFICENGAHRSTFCLQFHKGVTYVWSRYLGEDPEWKTIKPL